MTHLQNVCHSSMSNNSNTEIMLNIFEFISETQQYKPAGRTGLCKATTTLSADITQHVPETGIWIHYIWQ